MDRTDQWIAAALRAAILVLFLWMIQSVLVPIALGAVFALIMSPLQDRLARRLGRRAWLSPMLLTAGVVVLVVIPFAFLAVRVAVAISRLLEGGAPDVLGALARFRETRIAWLGSRFDLDVDKLAARLGDILQRAGVYLAGLVGSFAQSLPGRLVGLFLFTVALYYFLRDGRRLTRFLQDISPLHERETQELAASLEATIRGAMLGQFVTSGVQGVLTFIALLIFKVPNALPLTLIATLLSVIPMVGTTPATVGSVIYLLAVGRYGAAAGMAVAAVLIGLSDNVVRPWVQSGDGQLHPVLVLVSIFGGIEAFGGAGVFLGPVVAAVAVWVLSTYARQRRRRPGR